MKIVATIFLLFVYSFATVGTVLRIHYCMGKYSNWSLSYVVSRHCERCGMDKASSEGCCHDIFKPIQIKGAHHPTDISFKLLDFSGFMVARPSFQHRYTALLQISNEAIIANISPPLIKPSLNIFNCTFLI